MSTTTVSRSLDVPSDAETRAALESAQRSFQGILAGWASDAMEIRRRGLDAVRWTDGDAWGESQAA